MRVSPAGCHTVPRTLSPRAAQLSCPGAARDHETTEQCLIGCLKTVVPGRVFRTLARALADRWPSRVVTVADVLVLYRTGQLAALHGLGPRRYAAIQNGLYIAGLITRQDTPGHSASTAAQGAGARDQAPGGSGKS